MLRPSSHLYFTERLENCKPHCDFEIRLCRHVREPFAGWHNVELFAIWRSSSRHNYIETLGWSKELEGTLVLPFPMLVVFEYYTGYVQKHFHCQDCVWRIVTSEIVVYTIIAILRLACAGNDAPFLAIVAD